MCVWEKERKKEKDKKYITPEKVAFFGGYFDHINRFTFVIYDVIYMAPPNAVDLSISNEQFYSVDIVIIT